MKVRCGCCGEYKDDLEFWNVYTGSNKRQELAELASQTIGVIKLRNNDAASSTSLNPLCVHQR